MFQHQIMTMTLKCVAQVLQFGLISHRAGTELNLSDLCEESVREFFQVLKHFDVTMHVAECENQVSESSIDDDAKEIENFNQSGTTEAITVCPINQHDANQDYVTGIEPGADCTFIPETFFLSRKLKQLKFSKVWEK